MKIGASTGPYVQYKLRPLEAVEDLVGHGFDLIEICCEEPSSYKIIQEDLPKLKKISAENEIEYTFHIHPGINLTLSEDMRREYTIESLKSHINIASALGCRTAVMHTGPRDPNYIRAITYSLDLIEQCRIPLYFLGGFEAFLRYVETGDYEYFVDYNIKQRHAPSEIVRVITLIAKQDFFESNRPMFDRGRDFLLWIKKYAPFIYKRYFTEPARTGVLPREVGYSFKLVKKWAKKNLEDIGFGAVKKAASEDLKKVNEHAKTLDIDLLFEDEVDDTKQWYALFGTPTEFKYLCEATGSGFCYDFTHGLARGYPPQDWKDVAGFIKEIHLSDDTKAKRDTHSAIETEAVWKKYKKDILELLRVCNDDVNIILEIFYPYKNLKGSNWLKLIGPSLAKSKKEVELLLDSL